MNYKKDIQEIMECLTHNIDEKLKVSYAKLARRYNCDYIIIKIVYQSKRINHLSQYFINI